MAFPKVFHAQSSGTPNCFYGRGWPSRIRKPVDPSSLAVPQLDPTHAPSLRNIHWLGRSVYFESVVQLITRTSVWHQSMRSLTFGPIVTVDDFEG
jgi:hypothetical protein